MNEISENQQVAPAEADTTHSILLMDNLHNQTNLLDDPQSKCGDLTQISPSLDHIRLCLVGISVDDKKTLDAAKKFNVPIITSETGSELIEDHNWTTYFILNDFEGPMYEAIYKSKHKIIGPPALQQAAELNDGLSHSNRPIYNNSMRGVITCFTGIRKKDELTRLVHLIHSMGGSIRKDMTSKVTHLICNSSGGEKYQYAMTFRLAVVRPEWVMEAWKRRNDSEFRATEDDFTKLHKLKPFEGQRICFFGFPTDEHQHMEDVLKTNGGVPTHIEDPECSHVIISNTDAHFPETLLPISKFQSSPDDDVLEETNCNNNPLCDNEEITKTPKVPFSPAKNRSFFERLQKVETVDTEPLNSLSVLNEEEHENSNEIKDRNDDESMKFDGSMAQSSQIHSSSPQSRLMADDDMESALDDDVLVTGQHDHKFLIPNNISPILKTKLTDDSLQMIEEEQDCLSAMDTSTYTSEKYDILKRKRPDDSFDNVSIMSTDSFAARTCGSAQKKPKLIRTGSITRGIRRSMSFVAMKTPITNILRSRRNSVDPNASISSVASVESMFNESIKRPIKDKLRSLKDKITKSGRKDINTPKSSKVKGGGKSKLGINENTELLCPIIDEIDFMTATPEETGFKTPLAPITKPFSLSSSSKNSATVIHNEKILTTTTTTSITTLTATTTTPFSQFNNGIQAPAMCTLTATTSVVIATQATSTITNDLMFCTDTQAVVDDHYVQTRPDIKTARTNNKTHIVKADWFWYTIQNGFADEMDYLFEDYLDSIANTPANGDRRDSLPISFNKRKRKRISLRVPIEGTPLGSGKRRSSVSDAHQLSVSGSFLDCTTSPDKHEGSKNLIDSEKSLEQNAKSMSMRHNHFMDFFHTESNYVGILDTIVTLFKEPLEKMLEKDADNALLNKSELKSIFSNFQPIYDVHKTMLNRLKEIQSQWTEECLIGQIILDNRNDLIKAYPPYVNFFEQMKETLLQCDQQNPRFHAFLKICQAKPECGRQNLQDLMIRPVQRLPSISLLLNDIVKHTAKNNPDHKKLDDAMKAIKEVMTYINEDKRKTEGQLVMFDIFNEIDNCPPHLVSSHRVFVSRCEVTELSESLSGRGDSLMLFLFSDTLEVCKKRSRVFSNAKSPSTTTLNALNTTRVQANKPYKHIKFMPLSSIRLVVDVRDSPRAFALNCRSSQDQKEKLYSFSISDEEVDKIIYLKKLCKQLAENACKADADKFMVNVESDEIGIDISDVNLGTLSKAFKFATRTRLKVGRAFSFNKTPSKLKRAVSTMMSSPFGSTNSLTPASQMAQMKLASCTNINEVGEDCESSSSSSPTSSQILTAPMSVQPVRKNKNFIPVAALRRI